MHFTTVLAGLLATSSLVTASLRPRQAGQATVTLTVTASPRPSPTLVIATVPATPTTVLILVDQFGHRLTTASPSTTTVATKPTSASSPATASSPPGSVTTVYVAAPPPPPPPDRGPVKESEATPTDFSKPHMYCAIGLYRGGQSWPYSHHYVDVRGTGWQLNGDFKHILKQRGLKPNKYMWFEKDRGYAKWRAHGWDWRIKADIRAKDGDEERFKQAIRDAGWGHGPDGRDFDCINLGERYP